MTQKAQGFTVVELLTVIAVVGILAAITIVVYSSTGERARGGSITVDLVNAAKSMEIQKIRTGTYPTSLPDDVTPSQGNILHLAAVGDEKFRVNGYESRGAMYSIGAIGEPRSGLCDGALIGDPVGGSLPEVPTGVNLVSDFSAWELSGGVTYNSSTEQICLNSTAGTATSPLVRVDGSNYARFNVEAYTTKPAPSYPPDGRGYYSSRYFQADGITAASNTSGYTGNGNAQVLPVSTWRTHSWNAPSGSNVKYVRFIINSAPTSYTSDNCYRNPQVTVTKP